MGHSRRPWAVRVIHGPFASSMGRSRRPWAIRVIYGLFASSMGCSCRTWAVRVVPGPFVVLGLFGSSLVCSGPPWPFALSLSPVPLRLAHRVVLRLLVVPLCLRLRHRHVLWPFVVSCGRPRRCSAGTGCDSEVSSDGGRGKGSWLRTCWASRLLGPPWAVPSPSHVPIFAGPTSLSGGEGPGR
jgi:hypothetical protein